MILPCKHVWGSMPFQWWLAVVCARVHWGPVHIHVCRSAGVLGTPNSTNPFSSVRAVGGELACVVFLYCQV